MNEKQAIEVIKQVLDLATAKGIFATINDSAAVIEAFNIISKRINDETDANTDR